MRVVAYLAGCRDRWAEHSSGTVQVSEHVPSIKPRPIPPKIVAAKLWQRTRQDGGSYFAGSMGGVKVLVTPNREQTCLTDAGWVLIFQEEEPANKSQERAKHHEKTY